MQDGVARLRAKMPGIRVLGATVVTALGSTSAAHGFPEQDEKRKALNDFIRTSGVFDGVLDFDQATARSADRRAAAGVRAGQHRRRSRRQAASEPGRLSRHRDVDRPQDAPRQGASAGDAVERDDFSSSCHLALPLCSSMIFSENR